MEVCTLLCVYLCCEDIKLSSKAYNPHREQAFQITLKISLKFSKDRFIMSNRCSCTMLTELCQTGAGGRNTLSGPSLNTVAYMNEQGHPMSKLVGNLNIRNP